MNSLFELNMDQEIAAAINNTFEHLSFLLRSNLISEETYASHVEAYKDLILSVMGTIENEIQRLEDGESITVPIGSKYNPIDLSSDDECNLVLDILENHVTI